MTTAPDCAHDHDPRHGCDRVPEFDRLHYYYGQMLGPRDFQTEQDFFRNKLKLLNRCLHGYGVVCGLEVTAHQGEVAAAAQEGYKPDPNRPRPLLIRIGCGLALDPAGNELLIRESPPWEKEPGNSPSLDLWEILSKQEDGATVAEIRKRGCTLYISLCYEECKHAPQRIADSCADWCSNYETYARLRDSVCVKVTLQEPPTDERCEPCCAPFDESCVLLARIDNAFHPEIPPEVHNEVRRPLGLYLPTTITGINWRHGATYTEDQAEELLEEGLRIQFSRPVLTGTIKQGVVEVWRSDDWYQPHRGGDMKVLPISFQEFPGPTTTEVMFTVPEDLASDDRVLILVRTDFILDECCRPVDGNHVGGLVPLIPNCWTPTVFDEKQVPDPSHKCKQHGGLYGPWRSGNRAPGGTFESWFFTTRPQRPQKSQKLSP